MYIVVRRGAFSSIDEGGRLAGLAAVRVLSEFAGDPAIEAWLPRPGKVVLRARSPSQWARVLSEPHAAASDGVVALPPRRRSERGEALTKIQAMSTELEPPPAASDAPLVYALNPAITMSSGKTLAQIAHAAVMAAQLGYDVSAARVIAPERFDGLAGCVAEVRDAGLTEVPPGTITVRVLVREGEAKPDDHQRHHEHGALEPMRGARTQVPQHQDARQDDERELRVQRAGVPEPVVGRHPHAGGDQHDQRGQGRPPEAPRHRAQPLAVAPPQPRHDGDSQHELPAHEQRHRQHV